MEWYDPFEDPTVRGLFIVSYGMVFICCILGKKFHIFIFTSPAGSLLAVKLHSENGVIFKGKYEILISLMLQWQDNPRKTMRNQLS